MKTLKDLKHKIEELENILPDNLTLEDIPLQKSLYTEISEIEIEIHEYLGFKYAIIEIE